MRPEKSPTVLYSVTEAAARLSVAPKWLYERTRKNAIPYRRLGKYVRFSEADLAAIISSAFTPASLTNSGNSSIHDDSKPQREDAAGTHRRGAA